MNSEANQGHLLNASTMAKFAVDGFVEFDDLVPQELSEQVHQDALVYPANRGFDPNLPREFWDSSSAVREVFGLAAVKGVVRSLVGPSPVHNHSYLHTVPPGKLEAQRWHVDSALAAEHPRRFDVLVCFFPHTTPAEMGPTLVLPGSHLRRVSYHDVTRYKNFRGQVQLTGGGGRIAFMHESLWHCAQPNTTDNWRFMFKIRYQPNVPQRGLFDVEGWDDPEIHAFFNDARRRHVWVGDRFAAMERERLDWWRYLSGVS
tara:strand:+ start:1072 stop:1848 length:777 start_codon:yes stop_codon:yes gene_type:complete